MNRIIPISGKTKTPLSSSVVGVVMPHEGAVPSEPDHDHDRSFSFGSELGEQPPTLWIVVLVDVAGVGKRVLAPATSANA